MGSHEMGHLAENIKQQVAIWEDYGRQSGQSLPSVGFDTRTQVLSPQTPRSVLKARDKIIDSAFKLLQLAAVSNYDGPEMAASLQNFDHVPEEPIEYDELAKSANVPVLELKRILRITMARFIFSESEDGMVQHNTISRAFAHGENVRCGIPFFCNVVMPAAVKMEDATTRWPGSEDSDETARNIALGNDLTFPQYLAEHNQAEGYTRLMKLLGSEPSQQTVYSADIVHAFDWANLPRDSLVVDLGSCSSCSWELAELFPHLQFEVQGPQDKLFILKEFVTMKNPGLLAQIDFFPHDFRDEQVTHSAAVNLLAGTLDNLPDDDVKDILLNIAKAMSLASYIVIATSLRSEPDDDASHVKKRESLCRDMTMRQLQNAGARTISEWEELNDSVGQGFYCNAFNRLPGSMVTTMVVDIN